MRLLTPHEYECTGKKLAELQQWYEESRNRPTENEHVKELTLRSLGRLIKQLKEEMIWYECHARVPEPGEPALAPMSTSGGTSSPCTI
jgi:hypothetical protein